VIDMSYKDKTKQNNYNRMWMRKYRLNQKAGRKEFLKLMGDVKTEMKNGVYIKV